MAGLGAPGQGPACLAAADPEVEKVCIWTPDKDLAQCVAGDRVVQVDRKSGKIRNDRGVREKFGVEPRFVPDYLALVGDAADGYPGIPRFGAKTAARVIDRYGAIEDFPAEVLGDHRDEALLFKKLATLRTDAPLFDDVEELRWNGPMSGFAPFARGIGDDRLASRVEKMAMR